MGFECYCIGDLKLDAGTQEVTRNGEVLAVPGLSFKLLLSLARNAPNVVTTGQLEEDVWKGLVVDRGTISKRVLLLRKALGEAQGMGPYITVVRGSGYRLDVPVERLEESTGDTRGAETGTRTWYQRSSSVMRTFSYWLLGAVAILVLYQSYQNRSSQSTPAQSKPETSAVAKPPVTYSERSVAVLPFMDMSDSKGHQYLGDGLSEEVINVLTGMGGLEVAARTSSFAFRGSRATAVDIAQQLHVGTILEGSLRLEGDQVRITAQLIDASKGYHLWSKNYDREFTELFRVQNDIARDIAQTLRLTLEQSSIKQPEQGLTSNTQAISVYLRGKELLNNRISSRAKGLRQALDYFRQAIELDPQFARAHAGEAATYWLLSSYDLSLDRENYFAKAESSAKIALELDPQSIDALGVLAAINSVRGNIGQAMARFEQIRALERTNSDILHWQAAFLIRLGYFHSLIPELAEAYRLDPLNERLGWSLALAYTYAGKPRQAAEIFSKLEHFSYRDFHLALIAIYEGDYSRARDLLGDGRMRSGTLPAKFADILVEGLQHSDRFEASAARLAEAVDTGELERLVGFEALLVLGSARAFDLGIDPYSIQKVQILALIWNSWAVGLRQDPGFKQWIEILGFIEFWHMYGWPDRCQPTGPDTFECI